MEVEHLLQLRNLKTYFYQDGNIIRAVDGVDLVIERGQMVGMVGESGCGKTVTALSITRLLPQAAKIVEGRVMFRGKDLLSLEAEALRNIRGRQISYIFQEPSTSLNPVFTVGEQLKEAIALHQKEMGDKAIQYATDMLELVGMPSPKERLNSYPHQLSGGMKQRVMIAMAISGNPYLLIADEPTTALDATIQAQILTLLSELKERKGLSILLITHDLSVVARFCDRIAIMYAGRILEYADRDTIYDEPQHPYTRGLINCIPKIKHLQERMIAISGSVPNPAELPSGCKFHPRCREARQLCRIQEPIMKEIKPSHGLRCHNR